MSFTIPGDLSLYSQAGLRKILEDAKNEWNTVFSTLDPNTVTDEQLQYAQDLQTFVRETGPAALKAVSESDKAQQERTARFSALNAQPDGDEGDAGEEEEEEAAPENFSIKDVVAAGGGNAGDIPVATLPRYSTLVAAAGVPNYEAGKPFATMLDVAKAFEARSAGHGAIRSGSGPVVDMHPVATLVRDYPAELSVNGDETDYAKLLTLTNESRLPGGSLIDAVELRRKQLAAQGQRGDALVAAAGWCAPSEVDYSICMQISTDGLADFPEVQARRGGIRHNTGIEFSSIFGGGTCATGTGPSGFFNLTEAQVASGTTKTCIEIPCPSFTDTRLGVTGLCLTGNILSIRGYPEFTETFTRGAVAASAHQVNREQIAAVVSGSTAVDLTAFAPWATDGSTVSQVLSAVDMAQTDIKYKLRMQQNATLEVIMPWWVLAQMRADWVRRPFADNDASSTLALADAAINAAFAARNVRVQYVYDWQDAFATCATTGSPGAATAITSLPKSLQFLVYPAGTWVRAVSDVITLNSVYDSTKLATNQVTHLFTETGWAMVQMCTTSRVYTVPICPSGKTTSTGTLTCP